MIPDGLSGCPKGYEKICKDIYGLGNGLLCPFIEHDPKKIRQFKCVYKEWPIPKI